MGEPATGRSAKGNARPVPSGARRSRGHRLTWGHPVVIGAVLVVATGALGGRAWTDLRRGLRDTERMSLVFHRGFHTLSELQFHVGEARRMALSAMFAQDRAEQLRFADRAREAAEEVEVLFDRLSPSPVAFDGARAAWRDYWRAQHRILLDRLPRKATDVVFSPTTGLPRFERVEEQLAQASGAFRLHAVRQADLIDTEITSALTEVGVLWLAALVGIVSTIVHHHRRVSTTLELKAEGRRIALLESIVDAVVTVDDRDLVVEVNSSALRMLGASADPLAGRPFGTLVSAGDLRSEQGVAAWLAARCEETSDQRVEAVACRADGAPFPVEVRVVEHLAPEGRRYTAHLRDITERRRAEDELRRATRAAENAACAKSEYVAMISHEIRTPLNVLTGMAALLDDSPLTASQRAWVAAGRAASTAVLSVIDNVLDSARLEAGRLAVDPQPVEVRNIIAEVTAAVALSATQKRLALEQMVDDAVPALVMVDPARVRQVLINLLGNAVKFTRVGRIALRADATPIPGTDDTVLRFVVSDTGIGIEPDRLPTVFDTFRQADPSTYRLFGGAGLGLSISRRLARLMEGDLTVESRAGFGSTFTFTCRATVLMSAGDGEAGEARAEPPANPTASFSHELGQVHPLRVLVVDDDEASRTVAAELLSHFGYRADVASDGVRALAALDSTPYDLVFMDLQMPGVDGCEITRRVRDRTPPGTTPRIVALTANVGADDRARSRRAGMDDYLTKPVCLDDMHRILATTSPQGLSSAG